MNSNPTLDQVEELFDRAYGLTGRITRLPGENDNFQIETPEGQRYVLKLTGEAFSSEILDFESQIAAHIHTAEIGLQVPLAITTQSGAREASLHLADGTQMSARLFNFVPGTPWGESSLAGPTQLRDLGRTLGELDRALADFEHPAAHRSHRWDLAAATQHRGKVVLIADSAQRRIAEWMFHLCAACAVPKLPSLPHSIIHADANDENVLVQDGLITGLLDFSDSIHNPTICELAIALAYVMLDQPDPLRAGAEVVAGYHTVRPLSEDELALIYPLVCGRLCITITVAAERRQIDPDHPTWFVTEARAWELLKRLIEIDPADAAAQLAEHIDLDTDSDPGAPIDALLERRERCISPTLSIAYREPLKMVRGAGQYLYDHRGRPFLDLVNNVCHVGHCHPRVVEAGQRQMARLNTNTRYLYDGLTEYAERLCATLPEPLDTCFFVNSGSEANELALRLAMIHTGRRDILVVDGAYHGNTARLVEISPYKFMGSGGSGQPAPWVHVVPMPDGYRGLHKGHGRETGVAYGDEVSQVIAEANAPIAAFIVEPIFSCGGQIVPPEGYLETAFRHVRADGGVCIADEVQIGFGRVGTHFWGFELQDVIPDIVVMGKPIGNGHPMAAVVTTHAIAESFATGMEYFSTFGGNPVSCAIGLAVLDVIHDERLQQRALKVGTRLKDGLQSLMAAHPLIGDVRGVGLFIGVELVRDRETLEPAAQEADELVNRMMARGMLLSTDGPLHNVIKIKPPMVLTTDDVDMVVRAFDDELTRMRIRLAL